MKFVVKSSFFFVLCSIFSAAFAQHEISFNVENGPEFRDQNGNTLSLATVGGFNQPQFYVIDINNDGIKDLFVFDRSGSKVTSLIKDENGKYTHQPEYDQIFPKFSSWVVFRDYDGDGKEDLWYRDDENQNITLYRNTTANDDSQIHFTLVSSVLRAYNHGTPPLDTSDLYCDGTNIPAIEDVDGDGDIDFLTLQKYGAGITLFRNVTVENSLPLDPPVFIEADVCWGDFQEGDQTNEIFLQRNQWCWKKLKKHAGGSSLLLLDGDEDGDMDLVLGNAGFSNLIYLTNGKKNLNMKLDSMIAYDNKFPSNTKQAKMTAFPAPFYQDLDGDGVKDLLVAVNYTDKTSGYFRETGNIFMYQNTGKNNKPNFVFKDSAFLARDAVDFGSHTAPVLWDMDGDGDQDLIIATNGDWGLTADVHDRLVLFENIGTSTKAIFQMADNNFLNLEKDSIGRMVPTIGDLNKDGKPELLIGEVNGTLRLYNLLGSGKSTTAQLVSKNSFNIDVGSAATPHIADVDGDGDADLLIGCYEGNTFYFRNDATGTIPAFTLASDTFGGLMANRKISQYFYDETRDTFYDSLVYFSIGYSAPFIADLDTNGDPEFILGSEDGIFKIVRDIRKNAGSNFKAFDNINYSTRTGTCYNYSVGKSGIAAVADLDGDGIKDMIVGNYRGGIQYMRGTQKCNTYTVGIPDIKTAQIVMFPNPTNGTIHFSGLSSSKAHLEIYGLNGEVVMQKDFDTNDEVNVNHLSAGIYFVKVYSGRNVFQTKLVRMP
ncbi:MAG: T9SS type A sorting domain-containing protein [Bacteroidetes bacterium]|nr:T9SS type A sorting domain-containing protein [Bacteroidota bacterium]